MQAPAMAVIDIHALSADAASQALGQPVYLQPAQVGGMFLFTLMYVGGFWPTFSAWIPSSLSTFAQGVGGTVMGVVGAAAGSGMNIGWNPQQVSARISHEVEHDLEDDGAPTEDFEGACFRDVDTQERDYAARSLSAKARSLLQKGVLQAAIATVRGHVLESSLDADGCRVVQDILRSAGQSEGLELISELQLHIHEAIESKHANHVVQMAIQRFPASKVGFILKELEGNCCNLARHCFGCRVLSRVLEHFAEEQVVVGLIQELLLDTYHLSRHAFGHFVIQAVLEFGQPQHRESIASVFIRGGIQRHAKHRHTTCVLQKALQVCGTPVCDAIASALLEREDTIVDLARHPFGHYFVAMLVRSSKNADVSLRERIGQIVAPGSKHKYGMKLLQDLGWTALAKAEPTESLRISVKKCKGLCSEPITGESKQRVRWADLTDEEDHVYASDNTYMSKH